MPIDSACLSPSTRAHRCVECGSIFTKIHTTPCSREGLVWCRKTCVL